jgi:hypothetical protein
MILDVQKYIRTLAKSNYFQSLYSLGKEQSNIQIFENKMDFTDIQMMFLRYLNFYSSIFMDIALGDVDEIVLECDIFTDSYMLYKHTRDKTKIKDNISTPLLRNKEIVSGSTWVFKKPPKEGINK